MGLVQGMDALVPQIQRLKLLRLNLHACQCSIRLGVDLQLGNRYLELKSL